MFWKWCFRFIILCLGLWIILDLGSHLGAEIFWFQEIGYLQTFVLRLITQGALWVSVVSLSVIYLWGNLTVAKRWRYPQSFKSEPIRSGEKRLGRELINFPNSQYGRVYETLPVEAGNRQMRLRWLLPLTLSLSLLVGLMVTHYGKVALSYWHGEIDHVNSPFTILFRPEIVLQLSNRIVSQTWDFGLAVAMVMPLVGFAIALLVYSQFLLSAIALVFSLGFGWILSQNWSKILLYFHDNPFNSTEPLFGKDLSFYIFSLPVWELLAFWLIGLCLYGFISVTLTYLLSGDSLSQGIFPGFSPPQKRHLFGLGGCLMLVVALSYWLSRYELVYSPRGVSFGASYTDAKVQLPADTMLCVLAVAIAFYLLWQTIFWKPKSGHHQWVFYSLGAYLSLIILGDILVPAVVQSLIVQPNELQREQPYIQRTIALTRQAFDLESIDSQTFNPQGKLTEADLQANDLTIRNIRLWDQEPLLKTNRQLQQIRPYYQFPDADIDRYIIKTEPNQEATASTEKRQVLIAARELDYTSVPQQAQTWVNRNLIYTHGYGFTMSPVNTVVPGGLPEYFVKDISGNDSALTTSSAAIRESIPIGKPRIYYGEISNTHVMTGTKVRELDYPSGSDNVYTSYDGAGGIRIGSPWRRWLFATYLKDWQMIFTRNFLPETKVLFRRNINQRIRAIAPFLKFDGEPYLVAADAYAGNKKGQFPGANNYLYWIVDAYTTSDRYPYSDQNDEGINYIRNSVKVVIDAYNGTVRFYIAEPKDPLINAWSKIFPQMFQPLANMPVNLRSHIRYPVDFFKIQSERLMTYHITNPQVFYNREDQWQIPNEIYGAETRQVEPYYLITSLPGVPFEEFILLLPYTPKERTNLIAWLAARSDGENYGKLLLYNFPKERLIYGTEQIEARINQDPVISQQISLWNRQGSRAIQGNLLIIPIEQSLLYVEPIYLEATQNSLPTLVRVVVAYENRIVMAQTLEQALQGIFQPEETPAPPIIRPLEEEGIPSE
ncbi:UPF0182 family protein [Anabaena cylindrica FACHB-243]|uniref:UPF0182 protein Anacy_1030 n=1 Tax=Anabaena cylindrica (strain ATCC 27899 / PCC 7122) TaxID=272123 RepID=K9ZBM3_ANACC|nr:MULTISPECIES: UPF0182 family protein [Anabaena]AFZ56603.1 UPF0182 protein [Anabaena cylindrica PCC 7122]MBD2416225.1 UPF0182 family protein [Anabaena cylindrica FACHB-243]MBY5285338.1 UPF0182 family protein [Anabaena sp. CCAP 1446/1C]MBY5310787.1 UPF0182 family protein [Anabaena sp. CCAP 1446/1C]MCM2408896.1 UPF0182 family protein [Anabaena sp. CCAP 1446/1C]